MKTFMARKETTLRAIEASNNREYKRNKFKADTHVRAILEDVLKSGEPNESLIAFHRNSEK